MLEKGLDVTLLNGTPNRQHETIVAIEVLGGKTTFATRTMLKLQIGNSPIFKLQVQISKLALVQGIIVGHVVACSQTSYLKFMGYKEYGFLSVHYVGAMEQELLAKEEVGQVILVAKTKRLMMQTNMVGAHVQIVPSVMNMLRKMQGEERGVVTRGCSVTIDHEVLPSILYLKYGDHSQNETRNNYHLTRDYNPIDNPALIIRVRGYDQSMFELTCDKGGSICTCPNYEKLSQRSEKIQARRQQSAHFQELSLTLRFVVEDDAHSIDTNEIKEVEESFMKLLTDYHIDEDETMLSRHIAERIMALQHKMVVEYSRKKNLPLQCLQNLDDIFCYENLSLTENMNLLDAIVNVSLTDSEVDDLSMLQKSSVIEERSYYILCIMNKLCKNSKTLAGSITKSLLHNFSQYSQEIIGYLIFNEIWTAVQAFEFYLEACSKITLQDNVERILHQVQTYQITLKNAISALQENDPINYLKAVIQKEKDKDVKSIVQEMRSLGHPENILKTIEEVLQKVLDRLPCYKLKNLDEAMRDKGIKDVKNLDFLNPNPETLVNILIGLSVAVEDLTTRGNIKGYFPRASQLAALLTLLLSADSGTCLLEIAAGEGKSCIIAMFALIQAIRGKTVDIITSSPVLARRDHEEWKKIYEMFNVTCSVVPPQGLDGCSNSKERDTLINNAYSNNIVYGTVDNFAADILRQEFEKKKTRGNRKFDIAIVDEVDYMTLDNGVQITYLSHEATGMRHLDQLLCAIWARVCMCQRIEEAETGDILWTTRVQYFHKLAVDAVMGQEKSGNFSPNEFLVCAVELGLISEEDLQIIHGKEAHSSDSSSTDLKNSQLENLLKKFAPSQQKDLFTIFGKAMGDVVKFKLYELKDGKASFVDSTCTTENEYTISVLLLEEGKACLLMTEKDLIEATAEDISSKTKYSDTYTHSVEERDNSVILLPGHLKEFINNRLRVFVENALRAIMMEKSREYTIDCRENASSTTNECIIPIDFKSTGVLEKNKRWGDGLQQFLEIKHQLAITALSHVTNFMSNFHFFQRYTCNSGVYGVSGTLGDEADFKFLKEQYKTSCYVMPTHRYTKKVELPVQQVEGGRESWLLEICNCVKLRASPKTWLQGQAVLVVCEDVKTAEELQEKLIDLKTIPKPEKITLYTRNDKHNIELKVFNSEEVILATNLGGRGTDIKVTEEVNQSGGLSVILTHFPPNKRVEKQIFGRTSRKGNPGMVQMILNQQDLAPAYQGQPMEVIRELREKYETDRILDMENDELLEINIRHELFTFFCNFLEQFKKSYSLIEQEDVYKRNDVNKDLSNDSKLDYQPALNALKETWALWLTFHEEDINNHKDLDFLKEELRSTLTKTSEDLLQGKSNNFYDFIKVAMDYTYLHINNKSHDYGALSYWKKAENADGVYKAISLYNQAFIKINLGEKNYKTEAIRLLKETKETMNVYVSEVSNTDFFGKMTQFSKFKAHNQDTNFTLQNEMRMNLLKSWANYIDNSLEKLKELQENEDAQTKEINVFSLYEDYDTLVADELSLLYDYGLSIVFEVEKKPRFCINALIVFILGALQVLAGIAIWVLSLGSASQIGMGLISEGVRDMINGAIGMIKGSFDWAEWAISKAINIGLLLVTAGFFALGKSINVDKELRNGTRTLTSVAKDMIKSRKKLVSSFTTSAKSVASTVTKEAVTKSIKNLATSSATKEIFKKSAKYAAKELSKQANLKALDYDFEKGAESAFKEIVNVALKEEFSNILKTNKQLDEALISFIVANAVPEHTLQAEHPENYKIDENLERKIKKIISDKCELAVTETVGDGKTLENVNQGLGTTCNFVVKILKDMEVSGAAVKGIELGIHLLKFQNQIADILRSPSRTLINDKVIPNLISQIPESTSFTKDVRHEFPDVKRLKTELQDVVFKDLFDHFNELLARKLTSLVQMTWENPYIKQGTQELAKNAGQWIKKVPMKNFFISQTKERSGDIQSNKTKSDNLHLGEPSKEEIHAFVQNVQEGNQPVTNLELKVLTKSKLLRGQGIALTAVHKDGKKQSTEHYPGSSSSATDILLQMQEGSEPGKHQFILLNPDGKVLCKPDEGKNGLYQALSYAIQEKETDHIDQLVVNLKQYVNNEMEKNLDQYVLLVKKELQRQKLRDLGEKYKLTGREMTATDKA
ncbi:uncharacterized protein O3C94_004944 [Discoglossus pictus]